MPEAGYTAVRGLRTHALLLAGIAAAVGTRVFFWAYTDRRFEDGLITITHAVNAADGLGLTHHPGEGHVHGFTSALSVLVPLAGELVHRGSGLLTLRLVSLLAAAATIYFGDRLARRLELGTAARIFLAGYLAVDYLQIFYGMAGMETQIAVAVLLWSALAIHEQRPVVGGISLGVALLARPDFVLWAAPAFAWLVFSAWRGRIEPANVLKAGAGALAVVVPWICFTTLYYGSPVPHTIVAKSVAYATLPWGEGLGAWGSALHQHYTDVRVAIASAFTPLDEIYFARKHTFSYVPVLIGLLALVGFLSRRRATLVRPLVLFVAAFFAYLFVLDPPGYFRWYLPPFLAVIALLAAAGIDVCARRSRVGAAALSVLLVTLFAIQIPVFFPFDRTIQHRIEERVREPLGKYLHRVVRPGQTVLSESAGYIGYYGHVKLYDFPGLTSPAVSNVLATLPRGERTLPAVVEHLRPDWLVLRPWEAQAVVAAYPRAPKEYVRVRRFFVSEPSSRLDRFGVEIFNADREFRVYRRVAAG
jgi:hypothetical protein